MSQNVALIFSTFLWPPESLLQHPCLHAQLQVLVKDYKVPQGAPPRGRLYFTLYAAKPRERNSGEMFSPTWPKNVVKSWQNFLPVFGLQFPGKVVAEDFTKNRRQIPRAMKQKSLTARLWELGRAQHSCKFSRPFIQSVKSTLSYHPHQKITGWKNCFQE